MQPFHSPFTNNISANHSISESYNTHYSLISMLTALLVQKAAEKNAEKIRPGQGQPFSHHLWHFAPTLSSWKNMPGRKGGGAFAFFDRLPQVKLGALFLVIRKTFCGIGRGTLSRYYIYIYQAFFLFLMKLMESIFTVPSSIVLFLI